MKSVFPVFIVSAVFPTMALAQSNLPRCSDDMPALRVENTFLDAEGYPLQQPTAQQELAVTTTDPCLDRYVFITDFGPVVAPDAQITFSGRWEQIGRRRVARSGEAEEFGYSSGISVSEELAREISASAGIGATASVEPFGIGVEATVEASVGYALSLASGTEESQDWEHSVSVNPGEEVIIWARRLQVHVEWDPSESYPFTDPFGSPLRFVNETHIPSLAQQFLENPDLSETQANLLAEPMRELLTFPNPPTNELDLSRHAQALSMMFEFLERHDERMVSTYMLPMQETYTVRYQY